MIALLPALLILAFAAIVAATAASDLATMTIPNWMSIALVLLFPVAAMSAGLPWTQIALHLGVGILIFILGYVLFALHILGGGDVKVIAAVSVWTGASALIPFTYAMCIAGGALALILLGARKLASPGPNHPAYLNRLLDPARGAPYAVAIAAGAYFSLPAQPIFRALFA